MNVRWVRIRSWHIVKKQIIGNAFLTLCGRHASGPDLEDRWGHGKTCESCYRIGGPK